MRIDGVEVVVSRDGLPPQVLESGPQMKGGEGKMTHEVMLESTRKDYGNGVTIRVTATFAVDGTAEDRARASDAGVEEYVAAMRRHKVTLQKLLRASMYGPGEFGNWDPSGDSVVEPKPIAAPPASPIAAPLPIAAPVAPPRPGLPPTIKIPKAP